MLNKGKSINDELITQWDYNSSHFIAFEVVQESLVLLLPLVVAPTKLIHDLIRATICIFAGTMICIDALRFKYSLTNDFSEEKKAVVTLAIISYIESLTASGDILGNVAQKVQDICSMIALVSFIGLAITISLQLVSLAVLAFKTFQRYSAGDPKYAASCKELKKNSMHILFECFFGFSAFTGVFAMNALTLGIATGVIALLLCLVLLHKRQLEKQESKINEQTEKPKKRESEDPNATTEETRKLLGKAPVASDLPKVTNVSSTLFEKTSVTESEPIKNAADKLAKDRWEADAVPSM